MKAQPKLEDGSRRTVTAEQFIELKINDKPDLVGPPISVDPARISVQMGEAWSLQPGD